MIESFANLPNLILFAFILLVLYSLWMPFFRGRKVTATVEDYVHPISGSDRNLVWCYKLCYKEKNGKRHYVQSKRQKDTRKEMMEIAKGSKVDILVYTGNNDVETAIILTDGKEKAETIKYSVLVVVGTIAVAIGLGFIQAKFL